MAIPITTAELIRNLYKHWNISAAELGRRIGQSWQNLYKKLQRNTLSIDEIKQIADALGVKFVQPFILWADSSIKLRVEVFEQEIVRFFNDRGKI